MDSAKKSGHPLLMEKAGLCVNFVPLAFKFWEVESSFIRSVHMYLLYIQCVMRRPVHNVLQERNNTNGKENIPHLTWWKVYLGWQVLHTRLQCQNWGKTLFPSKCVCFFPVNAFSYKINTKIPNCIYLFLIEMFRDNRSWMHKNDWLRIRKRQNPQEDYRSVISLQNILDNIWKARCIILK